MLEEEFIGGHCQRVCHVQYLFFLFLKKMAYDLGGRGIFGDVRHEFVLISQACIFHFQHIKEQIVSVAVVQIESAAADATGVNYVFHCDLLVPHFTEKISGSLQY